jgi:cysteine desulfurase/selenocysteine lyase
MLSTEDIRSRFPIFERTVRGQPLAYLDNAATTQKPYAVIRAVSRFYAEHNANIARGAHTLAGEATSLFEEARDTVAGFLNADTDEIIFTRSTTESVNLVAEKFARPRLNEHAEVLVTQMEHHSNFVPWQRACEATGATLRVLPIRDDGTLALDQMEHYLSEQTAIVALSHVSNTLGTINDVKRCIDIAHANNVPVFIDGAQAVSHMPVDVQALNCDFYAFSGHKLFGPTGVGVLYGNTELLHEMEPYQSGGGMVKRVSKNGTRFRNPPHRFEAGTPHIAGVVGLAEAVRFVNEIGFGDIQSHENELMDDLLDQLTSIDGLRVLGDPQKRGPIVSFTLAGVHAHDLGTLLDERGVAIRSGKHCTEPLMDRFGVSATARISLAPYNTKAEIDQCLEAISYAQETFEV